MTSVEVSRFKDVMDFLAGVSMEMAIPVLNCFCRKYDLIFVEEGQVENEPVYRFIDFQNNHRYYTAAEINGKIHDENFIEKP